MSAHWWIIVGSFVMLLTEPMAPLPEARSQQGVRSQQPEADSPAQTITGTCGPVSQLAGPATPQPKRPGLPCRQTRAYPGWPPAPESVRCFPFAAHHPARPPMNPAIYPLFRVPRTTMPPPLPLHQASHLTPPPPPSLQQVDPRYPGSVSPIPPPRAQEAQNPATNEYTVQVKFVEVNEDQTERVVAFPRLRIDEGQWGNLTIGREVPLHEGSVRDLVSPLQAQPSPTGTEPAVPVVRIGHRLCVRVTPAAGNRVRLDLIAEQQEVAEANRDSIEVQTTGSRVVRKLRLKETTSINLPEDNEATRRYRLDVVVIQPGS